MSQSNAPILVVGAGPTGLAMGAILSKLGVPVRVIEQNSVRSPFSKALGVQAGTLESIAQVFGDEFVDRWVQAGKRAERAYLHVEARPPEVVDLSGIPGRYGFILILSQMETERLLEEQLTELGGHVESNGVRGL